jgi:hypothetical protein
MDPDKLIRWIVAWFLVACSLFAVVAIAIYLAGC